MCKKRKRLNNGMATKWRQVMVAIDRIVWTKQKIPHRRSIKKPGQSNSHNLSPLSHPTKIMSIFQNSFWNNSNRARKKVKSPSYLFEGHNEFSGLIFHSQVFSSLLHFLCLRPQQMIWFQVSLKRSPV